MPPMNYVLDSSAVICFLRDESGANVVEDLLQTSSRLKMAR